MKKLFTFLLVALAVTTAQAAPKKILVVSTTLGFRHSSIATGEKVLAELAKTSGAFTVDFLQQPPGKPAALKKDASAEAKAAFAAAEAQWEKTALQPALQKLAPAALKNYDGVIFLSTTGMLPIPDMDGFLNWIKSGGAFIGIHAASDTFHGSAEFCGMLGGEFLKHGPQVSVDCLNQDLDHPATKHLGKSWHIAQEEIYELKNYDPAKVHDLLIFDKHPQTKDPGHFPSSWCKPFGQGRVFYAAIGHREDIWDGNPAIKDRKNGPETSQAYQAHLLGGIKWALKLAE
ncbi:MAG: ThuA domain-containing protein [Verrucomicrobia bacterium]|nr:ThuA domain-containing protein [Verrucomicrobiota bacterium]